MVQLYTTARPPREWLDDLAKAKEESAQASQNKLKITIPDLIDRVNDPTTTKAPLPTSPRSVESCLRLGIDPEDLIYRSPQQFRERETQEELVQLAFQHHESIRQERLNLLLEERKRIIEEEGGGPHAKKPGTLNNTETSGSEDMVEKERKRMEVMKRRQEKELQQIVAYELKRKEINDKAQEKLARQEERARVQREARKQAEEEWRRMQRERELKKMREEQEREEELKRLQEEKFQKEQEILKQEQIAEKIRKKEAYVKEQERMRKAEQARQETDRILAQQQQEIAERKEEMARRDRERERKTLQQQKELAAMNEEQRRLAAIRLQATLQANQSILQKRREEFEKREEMSESRRQLREQQRLQEDQLKREKELDKAQKRKTCYEQAQKQMQDRVNSIVTKQQIGEERMAQLQDLSRKQMAVRNLQRKLNMKLKREKVETMKKMQLFRREQLLNKIQEETNRTLGLLEEREKLQLARKEANMQASFQRQAMMQALESMQNQKSSFGGIRPQTA